MGNKGFEAALAAIEMASLKSAIHTQPRAVGKQKTAAIVVKKAKHNRRRS
jgi:hypothetical protein